MLDAACAFKLGAWAFTALAAALHAGELEFASLLADVASHTIEASEAVQERPRDVVRKAADRLARRIEREHRDWLVHEFGSDLSGRDEMAGMFAVIPDVLVQARSDLPARSTISAGFRSQVSCAVRQVRQCRGFARSSLNMAG